MSLPPLATPLTGRLPRPLVPVGFVILDPKQFEAVALNQYYAQKCTHASFIRNMSHYKFVRGKGDATKGVVTYSHPMLDRSNAGSLLLVRGRTRYHC